MNSIEHDVSRALRAYVQAVRTRPDPDALAMRVRRRRRRRHRALVAGTLAVVLVVAGVAAIARPRSSGPAAPAVLDDCSPRTTLPFRPTFLPEGTTMPPSQTLHDGVTVWIPPEGIIEIWHRPDVPQPFDPATIIVLGRPAAIGTISDGYSVVFNLGAGAPCSQWALVAHPNTTIQQLAQVATGLVPN